jgi:sugar lactone lactonase YvrE
MIKNALGRCGLAAALCLLSIVFSFSAGGEQSKVKVIVDNAKISRTPEIGGEVLVNVPLDTILTAEAKQGEWYKVGFSKDGAMISGYIHELLVEVVPEGEAAASPGAGGVVRSQGEIIAQIEIKLDAARNLIRQGQGLEAAAADLEPLLAKAFAVEDHQRQRRIACEIYLWLGLAAAKRGDNPGSLQRFRAMFEVDENFAREITRNIADPVASGLIEHAEKQYRGLLVEYSLEIVTEPKEARIKIDGKEAGTSPEVYRTGVPSFSLEISKEGYKTISESIFLNQATTRKEYTLECIGRTISVRSRPRGAVILLDSTETGKVTDAELPYVSFGNHQLMLKKESYADWEQAIDLVQGPTPLAVDVALVAREYAFARKWGGEESRLFKQPKAVAFDREGSFYVTDESDFKLKKFDSEARFQPGWGDSGREFRGLKEAVDVAVDSQGFIYVVDDKDASVTKFAKTGKFIAKWKEAGPKGDELKSPSGIAVDLNDEIYVADSGNHRLVKFTPAGVPKKVWGKQGTAKGEFFFPADVAVNSKNEILVIDRSRVQKFSRDGEWLAAWGRPGTGEGAFARPVSLCVDPIDAVYVVDAATGRVIKFDGTGKFVCQWGGLGAKDGQLTLPAGIAADRNGNIFVVETGNNRLQEFKGPAR